MITKITDNVNQFDHEIGTTLDIREKLIIRYAIFYDVNLSLSFTLGSDIDMKFRTGRNWRAYDVRSFEVALRLICEEKFVF